MKTLKDILFKTAIINIIGSTNREISSVCFDSRKVIQKSLFVAVKGTKVDGHKFIKQAIDNGADAIVCETLPENIKNEITYIKVKDSSYVLGYIASNFYDNPSYKLKLIGITGTNGKTTTVSLLYDLFHSLGYKPGLLSTIHNKINGEVLKTNHTTPDAVKINYLLGLMVDKGCTHCFMEVSSHAIVQNRIAGLKFTGAIFSNITHEHLDYHKTFEEYIKAKKKFFDNLPPDAFALSNIDDKNGKIMLQNTKASKYTYSLKSTADFKGKIIENQLEGLKLNIDGKDVWCRLVGKFNAYNLLAVYAAAVLLKEDKSEILTIMSNLKTVEGRFDYIKNDKNITAIVDYAHTPDALKNVLNTILKLKNKKQKIITVFGAGGDRDKQKRPIMAKFACDKSDTVILTSDNPRTEDPNIIIEDMKKGIEKSHLKDVLIITNRKQAIKTAYAIAKPGDIILVAGKGHEKYQEINGVKYPFDDKEILREILL